MDNLKLQVYIFIETYVCIHICKIIHFYNKWIRKWRNCIRNHCIYKL